MSSRSKGPEQKSWMRRVGCCRSEAITGWDLEEVAREVGISRRTVYLHFDSKADLLLAAVHHLDETVGIPKILRQAHEAGTALESLDEWGAAYGKIEPKIYDIARVIYAARQSDQAAEASWQGHMAFRRE